MNTIYLIIWTSPISGQAYRFETEYPYDAADFAADCLEDGCEIETFVKEEDFINFEPINF